MSLRPIKTGVPTIIIGGDFVQDLYEVEAKNLLKIIRLYDLDISIEPIENFLRTLVERRLASINTLYGIKIAEWHKIQYELEGNRKRPDETLSDLLQVLVERKVRERDKEWLKALEPIRADVKECIEAIRSLTPTQDSK